MEAGFIKNNKPSLSTVTLGTDLNANGDTIDPGERTVPPLNGADLLVDADTGFTAVNNRLYVGFVSVGGNGAVTYSLVEDGAPGTELVGVGDDFAVINTAGYAPDGVFSFTAMLEDSVGIQVSYPMDITIDNTDDTAPTIAFTPLSQSSVKGYGVLPEGHFDDDTAPPMDAEPDLSGIFNLDGSAHDDQRIQAIYLTIWKSGDIAAGYNSGLEFELASWDAADARLEYNDLLLDPVSGSPVYAANTWL